jgi:predicted amidohydrolase YtcJ
MRHADLVFTSRPAGAVAVRDGRIMAVGGDAAELIGRGTELVDLAGRLLLPGFQDAHVHAAAGGIELGQCDLTDATSPRECLHRIGEYARAHPEREWIVGGGWALGLFDGGTPGRELLDAVVPDRPVCLVNRDHHGSWVNSVALARAGIDRHTPDPVDGRIERDADGTPSGMLQEGAMALVSAVLPESTTAEQVAGLLRAQRLLHSLGITAWQDALVGAHNGMPDPTPAYLDLASTGRLTARVSAALWWERDRGAEQIEDLLRRRARLEQVGIRANTVKIMLDGIAENRTAAMLASYVGGDGSGLSFVDPAELRAHVSLVDSLGLQVHFHAVGDRAVRDALDAIEQARADNGRTDNRHQLAHLQVVHPDDIPRFRTLDAIANIQPLWAAHEPDLDELTIPFLGPRRSAWQYPFGSLLRAGATIAAGSDWPVSSPNPLWGIHVAVNRIAPGSAEPAFLPEQRIDLASAIAAYTSGAAYANHLDDTGTIAPGNRADLVVLDRDPFDGPAEDIADTRVEQTFVGGIRVYAKEK